MHVKSAGTSTIFGFGLDVSAIGLFSILFDALFMDEEDDNEEDDFVVGFVFLLRMFVF